LWLGAWRPRLPALADPVPAESARRHASGGRLLVAVSKRDHGLPVARYVRRRRPLAELARPLAQLIARLVRAGEGLLEQREDLAVLEDVEGQRDWWAD
jgi:hypothetical protein